MVWRTEKQTVVREDDREVCFKEMMVKPTAKGQEETRCTQSLGKKNFTYSLPVTAKFLRQERV